MESVGWAAVILDEVHRLKGFTGKTSRTVRRITAACPRVWALSGTPAPNGLQDWLGVLAALGPDVIPCRTKTDFEARYCVRGRLGGDGPWVITGYRNVHELHRYAAAVTHRHTKAQCLDLPPKVFSTRSVALGEEQGRVYRELKNAAVARLAKAKADSTLTVRNVLSESLRLLQVVGGFVPDDAGRVHRIDAVPAKRGALDEVLEECGRPVVVWAAFKDEVAHLAAHLGRQGRVVTLTGDTPAPDRAKAVADFQNGRADFFIGTSAGGTAITLTAADTEIFYSRTWNLADYLQAVDRLHRVGQSRTVNVVHLVCRGTVDEKVEEALRRKADLMTMLVEYGPETLL
jgi:SNF2 family DNA or RNA helicase